MSRKFSFCRPTQRANMINALESLRQTLGTDFVQYMRRPRGTLGRMIKIVAAANNISPSALSTVFHGVDNSDWRSNGTTERSNDIEAFRNALLTGDHDFAGVTDQVFGKVGAGKSVDESASFLEAGLLKLL